MIYFIRHAKTEGNIKGVWVGRHDQPVHDSCLDELAKVAIDLSVVEFDLVFSSPLQRAVTTAKVIVQYQKNTSEFYIANELVERDFSEFEGKVKTLKNRRLLELSRAVESLESMRERLECFFLSQIDADKNILIVSHSAVFKCLIKEMGMSTKSGKQSLNNLEWDVLYRGE